MIREQGFTLIEMLLSTSIIVVLVSLSLPFYVSFQSRNDEALAAQTLVETLRRAETYARGSRGDSVWSVEIQATAITLFKGASFSGRDTSFDEPTSVPSSITLGGLTEVQFAKFTAFPATPGSITLASTGNTTRTVTINAKGMVQN